MQHKRTVGIMIKKLSNQMKRNLNKSTIESIDGMTGMHQMIVGYLGMHQDQDIFQKDIEERFNIRRSTASGILQLMEKNKLIVKEPVNRDARLKKLSLTKKGKEVHEAHHRDIEELEARLINGLTDKEVEIFLDLAERILENAKNKP